MGFTLATSRFSLYLGSEVIIPIYVLFIFFQNDLRTEKEKVEKLEKSICLASEDAQVQVRITFILTTRRNRSWKINRDDL